MPFIYRARVAMLMLIVLVTLVACAPAIKTVGDYEIIADTSGLELDDSQAPTLFFLRPGAPTLEAYDRFIVDYVQVNYTDPN